MPEDKIFSDTLKVDLAGLISKYSLAEVQEMLQFFNPDYKSTESSETERDTDETRDIFVLATPDGFFELDDLDEARDILQDLSDEGIPVIAEECMVYKTKVSNSYEVKNNFELVKSI